MNPPDEPADEPATNSLASAMLATLPTLKLLRCPPDAATDCTPFPRVVCVVGRGGFAGDAPADLGYSATDSAMTWLFDSNPAMAVLTASIHRALSA